MSRTLFEPLWLFRTRDSQVEPQPLHPDPAPGDQCAIMRPLAEEALQRCLAAGTVRTAEERNDLRFDIRRIPLPGGHGLLLAAGGGREGEARTRAELSSLKHDNRELEAIFESSHDGIVVADGKGVLLRISNSYSRITGIPKEALIGKHVDDMVAEGSVTPSGTALALRTRKSVTLTQTFRGGRTSVVTSTPIMDDNGEIVRVVTNVRDMTEIQKLRDELAESRKKLDRYSRLVENLTQVQGAEDGMVFRSSRMEALRERALKFAPVDAPLLITGESGTGKEVIANFVHRHSPRQARPFLKINCGAIPEQLLESELFGYEGGAFTGARREGHVGLVEMAKEGTLLLDEVGELSLNLQVKLLRFVQSREFFRVGGNRALSVDVRIIAATNQDLERMVQERRFRMDLFYRLNVCTLHVPPLAERLQDIVPLTHHFLRQCNEKHKTDKSFSPAVYRAFERHAWKGNVRELENIVERLVIVSPSSLIEYEHLPDELRDNSAGDGSGGPAQTYREALEGFERNYWAQAMKRYPSYRLAAAMLGVDHSTIVKKLARLGIRPSVRAGGKASQQ